MAAGSTRQPRRRHAPRNAVGAHERLLVAARATHDELVEELVFATAAIAEACLHFIGVVGSDQASIMVGVGGYIPDR
jgi:hypothetical protein